MIRRITIFLLVVLVLNSNLASFGADWNQFRGPNRTGRSAETGLLQKWPDTNPPLLWTFEGLGHGFGSVSVADGIIYAAGMIEKTGYLFAIDSKGKLKWKTEYGPEWAGDYPGTRTAMRAVLLELALVDEGVAPDSCRREIYEDVAKAGHVQDHPSVDGRRKRCRSDVFARL